jgi:hypothetical protein
MPRQELEHLIRAAAGTVNTRDIIVIGSQAILGSHPDASAELTQSIEASAGSLHQISSATEFATHRAWTRSRRSLLRAGSTK